MKTATELARELTSGPELDALFFERCLGWVRCDKSDVVLVPHWIDDEGCVAFEPDSVSTDAAACEAWAMRWAREKGCLWSAGMGDDEDYWSELEHYDATGKLFDLIERGTDWKDAFVRVCIAAAEQLNPKGAERGT